MINPIAFCSFQGAHWLLFGPNVPPLIYYSHIPNIIISLFLAFYILFKDKKNLSNKVLFYTILAFELWVFFALIFWASNRSDVVMFAWLMDILVEPLVYIGALYLLHTLIDKKDISFNKKFFLGILYLPIIIFLPTKLMLSGFDVGTCLAVEGPLALYYTYFVEILVILWTIVFCVMRYIEEKDSTIKKEILYLSIGTILLLFAFAWGNIIGSFSDNWILGDYGLFAMPIFIAFLVYSIVKFKTFNMKLLSTQALVIGQGIIIASLLFIQDISYIYVVISLSLILYLILGIMIIRGVKREIVLREDLEIANEQQTTLLHFISHQVKGFLAKSRDVFSLFLEEDYGPLPDYLKVPAREGLDSGTKGVATVQEILNAANFKKGTVAHKSEPFDIKKLLLEIVDYQSKMAKDKGLSLETHINESETFEVVGDVEQMRNALRNLIDNSIKYTLTGGINVGLVKNAGKIVVSVKDTGVGIDPADRPQLWTEGVRGKDALKVNVDSTGYGLFIVKKIIESHHGRVWVESEGPGKGSTFFAELPAK